MCRIHREARSVNAAAFEHQPAESLYIHVRSQAGKIGNQPADHRIERRSDSFLDVDVNQVAGSDAKNFGEFRGEQESRRWYRQRLAMSVQQPV